MARLTNAEKRLIDYPPTPKTWRCKHKIRKGEDQLLSECGSVNSGRNKQCWLCTHLRPSKPVLLWPLYVKACAKAGVTPKGGTA